MLRRKSSGVVFAHRTRGHAKDMLSKVSSALTIGLDVHKIDVEVDSHKGNLPSFSIVGLPDLSVKEAKERVKAALRNCGINLPWQRVIVVNLAPADLKKEGPGFDLPIAVGLLSASEYPLSLEDSLFLGELALDGTVRRSYGVLPCVLFAKEQGYTYVYIPYENAAEGALVEGITIYPVRHLLQLVKHLLKEECIEPLARETVVGTSYATPSDIDMAFVRGQEQAKRALEIAAAGGHNVLLSGPPGSGKTLLARTFATILPQMTKSEIMEVTKIYSIAGMLTKDKLLVSERPFRAPHHTASSISIVGGGRIPRPGEITLAHRGVLFLDELPEFPRSVLEGLRQPLEDGFVTVSRVQANMTFPASFTLVAAQNPCPCGFYTDPEKECSCSLHQVRRYQARISGPLLDRIDLHVDVPRLKSDKIVDQETKDESSSAILARVEAARALQRARFEGGRISINAKMSNREIERVCPVPEDSIDILKAAIERFSMSPRAYFKVLKVARTIADIDGKSEIHSEHISEALQYRFRHIEQG